MKTICLQTGNKTTQQSVKAYVDTVGSALLSVGDSGSGIVTTGTTLTIVGSLTRYFSF